MRKVHEVGNISFRQAIDDFWCGFINFTGVSTRKGLFYNVIMWIPYMYLAMLNFYFYFYFSEELSWIAAIVMFIISYLAYLSAICRRLRDVGLSAIAVILLFGISIILDGLSYLFLMHQIYSFDILLSICNHIYCLIFIILLVLPSNCLRGKNGFLFLKN